MGTAVVDFAYFYDYLVTSRQTLFGWIRAQPPEVYTRAFPIGLGTIQTTLVHVASSEYGYVHRLLGRGSLPENNPFDRRPMPDLVPLLDAWDGQRPATRKTLASVTDPNRPIEYVWKSVRVRTVAGVIAGQVLFHEIHHRAQVMAMLRHAGVGAENLDLSLLMAERTPLG